MCPPRYWSLHVLNSDNPLKVITSSQGHFEKLTKGSISGYLSEVVEKCLNDVDGSKEYCQVTLIIWDSFLHDVQDTLSSILQEYSCRPEYDVGKATCPDIRHVIGLLTKVEELLLSLPSQLRDWHTLAHLAYQNLWLESVWLVLVNNSSKYNTQIHKWKNPHFWANKNCTVWSLKFDEACTQDEPYCSLTHHA